MVSILIISQNQKDREELALQLCQSYQIDRLDITVLQSETSIGIEDIRKLQATLLLKPLRSSFKAAIVYDIHTMTIEAQNAFLKTLEEPPTHTYILLTAESEIALLPTILSRCKIITLPQKIKMLSQEEKEKLEDNIAILMKDAIGNKLYLAQIYGDKKDTAVEWLENTMLYLREQLLSNASDQAKTIQLLLFLEQFQNTYHIIKTTNVSPRFALENLFLSL